MKVIGFGDNVSDIYIHTKKRYPGGNSVNFAVFAKQLGIPSAYMGVFGTDEIAVFIREKLTEIGIDLSHCVITEGAAGYAEVNLVDGDRVFVGGNEGGVSLEKPFVLNKENLQYLQGFDHIHCSCFANIEPQLAQLRDLKAMVSFDFSDHAEFREDAYLQQVCPYIDFALFSGSGLNTDEIQELVKKTMGLGVQYVLVTRGTRGSLLFHEEAIYEGEIEFVEVVDTMGAGDSYLTAFLIHFLQNGGSKVLSISPEAIREGLKNAASFSAKTCMVEGAFGYGQRYE